MLFQKKQPMGYELTHDTIAKQIFSKASTEAQSRRKVEKYIHERFLARQERGARLTQDDLDYITPYLSQINISQAEERFLDDERRALQLAKRRRRMLLIIAALVLIAFSLISFVLWQNAEIQKSKAIKAQYEALEKKEDAEGLAIVAGERRRIAEQAQQTAQEKEAEAIISANEANYEKDRATRALSNLNNTRKQVVNVLIEQAKDLIIELDYEGALIKLNTGGSLIEKYPPLARAFMEMTFFFAESYQFEKAAKTLDKAAMLSGMAKASDKLPAYSDTTSQLSYLRKALAKLDPDYFTTLQSRYYPEMIPIKGGTFEMGCLEEKANCLEIELPRHKVSLSAFQLARTETTVWQYYLYLVANETESVLSQKAPYWGLAGPDPMPKINWYEAILYANWASKNHGLTPVYQIDKDWNIQPDWNADGYRLPTEAEWEFAALGGGPQPDSFLYSGSDILDSVGINKNNNQINNVERPSAVGSLPPNRLGLVDMTGNLQEWCWDWFVKDYYSNSSTIDPKGPSTAPKQPLRITRGGSFLSDPNTCRNTFRNRHSPGTVGAPMGFRLAQNSN